MRQLLKFGHSMTAIVFLGAIAVLWVLHQQLPDPERALSLYAQARQAMERIAVLLLLPSLVLSLLFGLFSMAMVTGFHNAPWAWAKFVTTVVMLEGTLLGIQSPIVKEARRAEAALNDPTQLALLAQNLPAEQSSLVVIGVVATANVALGVWRPQFRSRSTASS